MIISWLDFTALCVYRAEEECVRADRQTSRSCSNLNRELISYHTDIRSTGEEFWELRWIGKQGMEQNGP